MTAFQHLLDKFAVENRLSADHGNNYSRLTICRMGEITFYYKPYKKLLSKGIIVEGECQTNLLGAGFHKAVVDLIDALQHSSKLSFEVEDETDYFVHRDFNKMRSEHFYKWLQKLANVCREEFEKNSSMKAICWDIHQYTPDEKDGAVCSPFGYLSVSSLLERIDKEGIESVAKEFFIWNNQEQDAFFYRNTALNALWEACYFMPSARSEEDKQINACIIANLEKAASMDPSLPFPKEAYLELCRLAVQTPIDLSNLPTYTTDYPIGFRKGDLTYRIGNLSFRLPGRFLYFNEDDSWGYSDNLEESWHTVFISSYTMPEENPGFLEHEGDIVVREQSFKDGQYRLYGVKGEDEFVCQVQTSTERQFTLFTFVCPTKEEVERFSSDFTNHLTAIKTES